MQVTANNPKAREYYHAEYIKLYDALKKAEIESQRMTTLGNLLKYRLAKNDFVNLLTREGKTL
jgi:hypothetical protein